MKCVLLFLFLISIAQASQEIPIDQINNVFNKLESRFTFNPTENKTYIWARYIGVNAWAKWRFCYLFPLTNSFIIDNIHTVVNPLNGKWFITNATVIEQSDIDWCTQ